MNLIKIQSGIATREPVPAFLIGLAPESLLDLSWTDPALGVRDCAWWPAEYADTPYDDSTQRLGAEQLTPDPGRHVVVVSREVVPLTGDEIAAEMEARSTAEATAVRMQRDALIATTDYLLMPDYPIDDKRLTDVRAYRQALRDVPLQTGFPQAIDWPTSPIITE